MISKEQLSDAVGAFTDLATVEVGNEFVTENAGLLSVPSYDHFKTALSIESNLGISALDKAEIIRNEQMLRVLGGLRVIVGQLVSVNGHEKRIFYPGIVLDDPSKPFEVSVIATAVDQTTDYKDLAKFSDLQQLILAGQLASSAPGVAKHTGDKINVTDVAHGQLIAVYSGNSNLHDVVHDVTDSGSLGTLVASKTSIVNGHSQRPTETKNLGIDKISALIITQHNQVPLPITDNAFELSTGFAAAARRTQLPNGKFSDSLKHNFDLMRQSL